MLAGVATPDKVELARLAGADAIVELWHPGLRDGLRAVELAEDVLAAARHGQEVLIP